MVRGMAGKLDPQLWQDPYEGKKKLLLWLVQQLGLKDTKHNEWEAT